MPKKKMATRVASSLWRYHVLSVNIAPGMYPASHKPRMLLATMKPVLFRTKICIVATRPKTMTWALMYILGPMRCRIMFDGISSTTIPRNIIWFPRLTSDCVMWMSVFRPLVRALARFMRSSWKTNSPRNRSGRTERSTLSKQDVSREVQLKILYQGEINRDIFYLHRARNDSAVSISATSVLARLSFELPSSGPLSLSVAFSKSWGTGMSAILMKVISI